jgi:hypothetical protein
MVYFSNCIDLSKHISEEAGKGFSNLNASLKHILKYSKLLIFS